MKKIFILLIVSTYMLVTFSTCRKSFLDIEPAGNLNQFSLATNEGINALLIGAYSMLYGVSSVTCGELLSTNLTGLLHTKKQCHGVGTFTEKQS